MKIVPSRPRALSDGAGAGAVAGTGAVAVSASALFAQTVIAFGVVAFAGAGLAFAHGDAACLKCHANPAFKRADGGSVAVDGERLAASLHGKAHRGHGLDRKMSQNRRSEGGRITMEHIEFGEKGSLHHPSQRAHQRGAQS